MNNKSKIKNQKSKIYQLPITNDKGVALIIVVAVVAVLSAIGVTFMYNMRLEEKASFNYLNNLKATHIAKSGIDHAVAVLKEDGGDTGFDSYNNDKWGYDTSFVTNVSVFGGSEVDLDETTITTNGTGGNESKWVYVTDDNGDTVGRYAVLIIDESGKININTAGSRISWDNTLSDPRQGWKPFEINLKDFLSVINAASPQTLANRIVNYRQGSSDGQYPPWREAGKDLDDDNADSIIWATDGIDNDADGIIDNWLDLDGNWSLADDLNDDGEPTWGEPNIDVLNDEPIEGVDDPYEFVSWNPYFNDIVAADGVRDFGEENFDTPFITIEEIKNIYYIGDDTFQDAKPYITVYSSDGNTNDSGFLRMNINLVKDATALYTVMYDAWEGLMASPYNYSYDEIRQLAAQLAVNTIDYADADNVSTFMELSRSDSGAVGSAGDYYLNASVNPHWDDDEWKGAKVKIIGGTGHGQVRRITGNGESSLDIFPQWDTVPDASSSYLIEDKVTARGVEAIRINEIMVKPAYQWEAEELFPSQNSLVGTKLGGTEWYFDSNVGDTFIYSQDESQTIEAKIDLKREGFYRVRALSYSNDIMPVEGTATDTTLTSLIDTGHLKPWKINEWKEATITIIGGHGKGQTKWILSNTADTINIYGSWDDPTPDAGSEYLLEKDNSFSVTIYDDETGDSVLADTAGDHNIGGWLLEDLGVPKRKDYEDEPLPVGTYTIELKTSDKLNHDTGARFDYIQLSQEPDCEYIELVNISEKDVDIGGWMLTTSAGYLGAIRPNTTIEAGDYLVLAVDKTDNLPGIKKNNICFMQTWEDADDDKVERLILATNDFFNIAQDASGDTIILPGSIFEDLPLTTPDVLEYSGAYIDISNNTLTVGGSPGWAADKWKGAVITATVRVDLGTGSFDDITVTRRILTNTANEVTISTRWDLDYDVTPPSNLTPNPEYYIRFEPMSVTLWDGMLNEQRIAAQVSYSAEDVNQICYVQDIDGDTTPVYGFVALEKNAPFTVSDDDEDRVDDWWLYNTEDLEVPEISGGTPGEKNSVVPEDRDTGEEINVRNMPFATIGDIRNISSIVTDNGTVSTAGADSFTDYSKTGDYEWREDQWEDAMVKIISGTGEGQIRTVTGNNEDTIWVDEPWDISLDTDSAYRIHHEWVKAGYDSFGDDDTELIQRIADKITVSDKRLEAENNEYYYTDPSTGSQWSGPTITGDFTTPCYTLSDITANNDTGFWGWGINQRINPDVGFYNLYISGKVERDIDNPDTMLVRVTTGRMDETRAVSFSGGDIACFGQIEVGESIDENYGDTDLLQIAIWKEDTVNAISFDAAILAPEYKTYGRININTADTPVLQALPGITSAIADEIVAYRESDVGYDGEYGFAGIDDNGVDGNNDSGEYNWPGSDDGPFNDIGEILNVRNPAIDLETFSKISNLITTKSKIFTVISTGQALRKSDKGTVINGGETYEILGEKKYIVVVER